MTAPARQRYSPQLSEAQVLAHAKYLSEDIGYRTVGSREHALGDAWILRQAEEVRAQCEAAVRAVPERKLECEVWHQKGSGHHRYVFITSTPEPFLPCPNAIRYAPFQLPHAYAVHGLGST